jgi:hypothetical protein
MTVTAADARTLGISASTQSVLGAAIGLSGCGSPRSRNFDSGGSPVKVLQIALRSILRSLPSPCRDQVDGHTQMGP